MCLTALIQRLDAEEAATTPPAAAIETTATLEVETAPQIISRKQAKRELGAVAFECHKTNSRINACMVEDEIQQILSERFDFGVRLHRYVAAGWKIEDKYKSSIVFFTVMPHTAPMEMNRISKSTGEKRPSHIFCGPNKTKLMVN